MFVIKTVRPQNVYMWWFSCIFLAWELVICHLARWGGGGDFAGYHYKKSLLVLGVHLWIRDPYLGGQINKPFERGTKQ